jgi:hypothetical protein
MSGSEVWHRSFDADAAALAQGEAGFAAQGVLGTDTGREQEHVGFQHAAIGEFEAVGGAFAVDDVLGGLLGVHFQPQALYLVLQQGAALGIQLYRHQPGGEFHHMGFQAEQAQGVGGFQAEQAAADHHAGLGIAAGGLDVGQIFQGTVDKTLVPLPAGDGRHEGGGAGGQHQAVVGEHGAGGGGQGLGVPVDGGYRLVKAQLEAAFAVPVGAGHQQGFRLLAVEHFGEVHPVVGGMLLGAEHRDVVLLHAVLVHQLLQQVVSDHAVADDNQFLFHHCYP